MHDQLGPALRRLAPNATWHMSGPIGRARKCNIFKITNNQDTHTLALKVYRDGKTNARGPQNQYEALQQLERTSGSAAINAPRAHAFLPDVNAIVMDWVDAPPLRNALWRSAFSSEDKLAYVKSAAQWLRRFHENSGIENKPFDATALCNQIENRLEQSPASAVDMRDSALFKSAYERLKTIASTNSVLAPHAKLHGDFTPTNILIKDNDAVGIDIWGVRYGTIYEDVARILTYLGINSPFALKRSVLMNEDDPTPLFHTFAQGYGADYMRCDASALWFSLLYQQLRRWLVFLDWKKQGRSAIKAKLEIERVKRLVIQSLRQIEKLD
ncbi:phosphotransferase family protein [Kordiimonas aquimaris]|uniref:phosphotransferase family protein n=1 Tax=Kordiimonas aquimaris TaxID=707591 RepID=UPI0021D13228|nr:aminoglycoside phosphotransferase family protein [Kordiimonas aquimaris]